MNYYQILAELKSMSSAERAKLLQRFFKTGSGEYGDGDLFLGVVVPDTRKVSKKYKDLPLGVVIELLHSRYHEARLASLFILIEQFQNGDEKMRKKIFNLYLKNTKYINNWDLVDSSAHKIVGQYLFNKDRVVLYKLARSKDLWEKRIAVISTFWFINYNQVDDSLKIAEILLNDEHDLIHKAVGWMLREVGKRDIKKEEVFLKKHFRKMPRTMLRYAIEKFPEKKRKGYLRKSDDKSVFTAEKLRKGSVGVLATDTLYGLVGLALDKKAVKRIYELKKRESKKPFIVLISSIKDLDLFGVKIDLETSRFLEKNWPGKMSVILPCVYKKFSYLHRDTKTLAFRLPAKKSLIKLLKKTGPLVAPSANLSGEKPALTIAQAKEYFGDKVDFYINVGKKTSLPSTLVAIKKGKVFVKRKGSFVIK